MRKTALAGPVLVMVLVLAASAAAKVKPKPAHLKVQSTLNVSIDQSTGTVTVQGRIKVNGKQVAVRLASAVTRSDYAGYACGSTLTMKGSAFHLALPGGFKVVAVMRTVKKWGGQIIKKVHLPVSVDLGADQLMCGKPPVTPLSPSVICDWGTPFCGTPHWKQPNHVPLILWDAKPAFDGNTFSVGHFSSPNGFCKLTYYKYPPGDDWYHVVRQNYWQCGDLAAEVTYAFWLVNPAGKVCQPRGPATGATIFQVPSDWGGYLEVAPAVGSYTGQPGRYWQMVGYEDSSVRLKLSGTADGCAELGLPTS